MALEIRRGEVDEVAVVVSVLDYCSVSIARYSIGSRPIRNPPAATHDGFAIFVGSCIVNTVHLILEVRNVLQLLVWGARNQSDGLELVVLFHGASLVFDYSHVCGGVHGLVHGLFSI